MTMQFRIKAAVFGLAALALGATSLGGTSARADQLDDIKKAGKLVAATEMHYAPFDMLKDGKYEGFDRDLFDQVAKEMGVTPEYQDLPWTSILPGLEVKKFDFVLAPVTYTKERAARYGFTRPIAPATVGLVQKKGGALTKPEDIKGKTVGIQKGTAQEKQLQAYAEKIGGATVKGYGTPDEAYADLAAGRLDAVAGSSPNLAYLAKTRADQFAVVNPAFGAPTYFGWVARKGDGDTLIAAVDAALDKIAKDGRMKAIQEKWFGVAADLPAKMPEL